MITVPAGKEEVLVIEGDATIVAEEGSIVRVESKPSGNVKRTITLHKDAQVTWNEHCTTSTKAELHAELQGEHAHLETKTIFHAKKRDDIDVFTKAVHTAPNTTCNLITRGVIGDKAKGISRGHIVITKDAHGSEGYEQLHNLVVSEEAQTEVIPLLDIHNHDVQCSHGATISNIDEEQLFYLMSRGLQKEKARELIINGFLEGAL